MFRRLWSTRPFNTDLGLLILRIGIAWMMMRHGTGKFMNFPEGAAKFPDPLGVGGSISMLLTIFAELFCSSFILLGLFTRLALIPLIINMLVIIFSIHLHDPLSDKEHAILFLAPFLMLFFTGPGKFSMDGLLKK